MVRLYPTKTKNPNPPYFLIEQFSENHEPAWLERRLSERLALLEFEICGGKELRSEGNAVAPVGLTPERR